jgi:uncharacterized protein (UPF0332 family)
VLTKNGEYKIDQRKKNEEVLFLVKEKRIFLNNLKSHGIR